MFRQKSIGAKTYYLSFKVSILKIAAFTVIFVAIGKHDSVSVFSKALCTFFLTRDFPLIRAQTILVPKAKCVHKYIYKRPVAHLSVDVKPGLFPI